MNASRLWAFGSIIVIIALIAGTWFVGISPQLGEAANANIERASVETLNAKHSATLAALKLQFDELPALKEDLEELQLSVPESDETAELLRQMDSIANSSGVTVTDLTLSAPVWFAAPAEAPADAELAAALGSVNPQNFLTIQVEQTVAGTYAAAMTYINTLQTGQRAFLVHDMSLETGLPADDAQVEIMLTGQIFVLLNGVAATSAEGEQAPVEGGEVPQ